MIKQCVTLKALSPVHIGNGLTYYPSSLVRRNNGMMLRIDPVKLYSYLDEQKGRDWLDYISASDASHYAGNFFAKNTDIKIQPDYSLYSMRYFGSNYNDGKLSFFAQGNVRNTLYWEAVKDQFNGVYVPGSSLKGFIRTALLLDVFKRSDIDRLFSNNIESENKKKENKEKVKYYEKKIKSLLEIDSGLKGIQNDAFRLIQIADSSSADVISLREVRNIGMAESGQGVPSYCECVDTGSELKTDITIVDEIKPDREKTARMLTKDAILHAIYNLSSLILENLDERLRDKQDKTKTNLSHAIQQVAQLMKLNDKDSPVIVLGKHKGIMANTLLPALKGTKYYTEILEEIPHPRKKKHDPSSFPISIHLVMDQEQKYILPGWMKISLT